MYIIPFPFRYVYGKKVQGVVSFRLGIKKPVDLEPTFFAIISPNKVNVL